MANNLITQVLFVFLMHTELPTCIPKINYTNDTMGDVDRQNDGTMPFAVVGLAGRFAGDASDINKLWDMCAAGENAWSPIPEARFTKAFYHPDGGRNGSVR